MPLILCLLCIIGAWIISKIEIWCAINKNDEATRRIKEYFKNNK